MIEVITHPITLLCLGVIFILCALLFFYFKRSMMVIENAQVEQATVLRKFIASMEMRKFDNLQMPTNEEHMHNYSGGENSNFNIVNSTSSHQDQTSLIDVSDNETSSEEEDDAYSENNAYETEESDSESEIDIESEHSIASPLHGKKESNIKVINVEDLEDLNKTFSEYKDKRHGSDKMDGDINDIDEDTVSTSCDDMFSTDLDRMEKDCEIDMKRLDTTSFIHSHDEFDTHNKSSLNLSTDASQQQDKFEHFDQMSILLSHDDFKGYTVSQIRDYAMHNDIIRKGDKMKKKDLVDHVIEANIHRGAENLKVNKVGSDRHDAEINLLVEKELDEVELDRKDQSTESLSTKIQITPSLPSDDTIDNQKMDTPYEDVESFEVELLEK